MNQNNFQILRQYLGIELLRYILNKNDLQAKDQLPDIIFTKEQLQVLEELSDKIQKMRINFVNRGGYGDILDSGFGIMNFKSTIPFNAYRQKCGGNGFNYSVSNDPLLEFFIKIAKENYPYLLINSSRKQTFPTNKFNISLGMSVYENFIALIKNDILDKLTNQKEKLDYSFRFTTECGIEVYMQVGVACSNIITRSFVNCCNRMTYKLEDFIAEIENNVKMLRSLANKEETEFCTFVGIKGLSSEDSATIDFGVAKLFPFKSIVNPSIQTKKIVAIHQVEPNNQYLSGCFLEIKHKIKVKTLNSDGNRSKAEKHRKIENEILQALKFALVFTLREDYGIVPSVFETGFPLTVPGNYGFNDISIGKYFLLKKSDIKTLLNWFELLREVDISHVKTTLTRLEYAIFGQKTPEDSIMDAIIAWEGMFSEAFETTFKVTGTIAKYLKTTPQSREIFLKRLKKLYNLRSEIVHGKSSKLLKSEDIYTLRKEVIDIGIEILTKLLKDKELLKLSPPERIKNILVYN